MGSLVDQFGTPFSQKPAPAIPIFDSLANEQTGMGIAGYDATVALQYTPPTFLTQYQAENAFLNSFIIGRFIELPAMHMTREWRTIKIEGDENVLVDAIENAEIALNVKQNLTDAIMWGDLYGGALVVMGLDGDALDQPLDVTRVQKGQLTSLTVIDRWQVTPSQEFILDPLDANFRYPQHYIINTQSIGIVPIHASRCLRFDGCRLPRLAWMRNGRWHGSTVQRVLEPIKGFEASIKASSKAMQEGAVDVYAIENLYERMTDSSGQSIVRNRVKMAADLKSIYRAVVIDMKDDLRRQPINVSGYDVLLEKHQDVVCGATEMPATLLFGRPPAGMNATGEADFRNWYDTLSIKQEFKLRPLLNQLDQVLVRSTLGYWPENYSFDFKPLWQVTDDEAATIDLKRAQTRHFYMTDGAYMPETCAADLLAEGFSVSMTQEDVDEIANYNEPITPVDAQGNPIDPQTLIASMTGANKLDGMGGPNATT
jgi:phage-related protein (TIGR01555 family)